MRQSLDGAQAEIGGNDQLLLVLIELAEGLMGDSLREDSQSGFGLCVK